MPQKSPASVNQLWHQSHVAQQSRRDKLRIPGSRHLLSSKSCDQIEPSSHATAAHLHSSIGYLQGYPTHIGQSNGGNVFPAYSIYMISSDPYDNPKDVELLPLPGKNTGHLQADSATQSPFVENNYPGPLTPISVNSLSNAPSKTGNCDFVGPQFGMMNKNAFLNAPLSVNVTATAVTSAVAANLLASPNIQTSTFGSNGREVNMATYFPSSNIQGDTMQTLYLMNPTVAGYADSIASGNIVLVNNSIESALATSNFAGNAESQQHFIGISLPAASHSQRSSVGGVENSPAEQQSVTSNLLTSRLGGNTYNSWQGAGNELTFLQTTDAASSNQSLCGQLNDSVSLGLQSVVEISQLGMRHAPMSSIEEQQSGMLSSGLGLQPDQPHGSTGHGRGLSLSLSSQQPSTVQLHSFQNQPAELDINCPGITQTTSEENMHGIDRTTNKWVGSLSSAQISLRDWMMGTGFSNSVHTPGASKQLQLDSGSTGAAGFATVLRGSKYLKAVQELLDEVVNIGNSINSDTAKHHKPQTRIGAVVDRENARIQAGGKDGVPDARTGIATSAKEIDEHAIELTMAERQELQMRKAKLVAMVDEVDRRYKQYYRQMQVVVSSFEAATEFGASKTYTALAFQTISRRFRCLRDAITGQICMTSRSLGEEDMKASGKGETSCLRFVDQHLRQQRALQQLGMIQQHVWRPQRGLPERSVSVLRAWLFEHFLHPYPKDADKHMLARQAGLTRSQVSNWFINARVRLWKPMVEEMYMEEIKEAEMFAATKASKESGEIKEGTEAMEGAGNSQNGQEEKHAKVVHLNNHMQNAGCGQQNGAVSAGLKFDHSSEKLNCRNQTFNMDGTSDDEAFHEVQKGGAMQGHLKKARNGIQDSTCLLSPNMNMDVDFKSDETCLEDVCDDSKFSDERQSSEEYSLIHGGMVHAGKSGSLGLCQISSLGRYDQDSFTPSFSGNGGVSLTLGLQHSDGLSLSATQQSCISSQGSKFDLHTTSDDYCNINETAAAHAANAYESINTHNRKRFATHLLHDFVA